MNQKFLWDQGSLSIVYPVVGPAPLVIAHIVYDSVKKIKSWKVDDPTGFVIEMLIAGGEVRMIIAADLISWIVRDRKFSKGWENSYTINL